MDTLLNENIQSGDKRAVEISIQRQEAMENDIQARVNDNFIIAKLQLYISTAIELNLHHITIYRRTVLHDYLNWLMN